MTIGQVKLPWEICRRIRSGTLDTNMSICLVLVCAWPSEPSGVKKVGFLGSSRTLLRILESPDQ